MGYHVHEFLDLDLEEEGETEKVSALPKKLPEGSKTDQDQGPGEDQGE